MGEQKKENINLKGIKDKLTTNRKKEINRLYCELGNVDPQEDPEKYYEILKSIEKLEDIKTIKRIKIDMGDVITALASLAGIGLILAFEGDGNVIHSKAISFVKK